MRLSLKGLGLEGLGFDSKRAAMRSGAVHAAPVKAIGAAGCCLGFALILSLAPAASAVAQQAAVPSGEWIVTWPNDSKNLLVLTNRDERLSGTYTNDDKQACSVSGSFRSSDRALSLQIVCAKWDTRMQ